MAVISSPALIIFKHRGKIRYSIQYPERNVIVLQSRYYSMTPVLLVDADLIASQEFVIKKIGFDLKSYMKFGLFGVLSIFFESLYGFSRVLCAFNIETMDAKKTTLDKSKEELIDIINSGIVSHVPKNELLHRVKKAKNPVQLITSLLDD